MTFFRPLSRRIGNEWGVSRRMSSMTVSSSTRYIQSASPKEIQATALRMSANQHLLSSSTSQRFLTSKPAEVTSAEIATPTSRQLGILALKAGIPMVGFGMMDNLVMIQAGEAIDASFGVIFSLSTLTAAGFGQCFSDVAGVTCGGAVDSAVGKLNLPKHGLSALQQDLKVSRIYRTAGGCVGVVIGCLLGMSCLFFMDTDRADRAKKAKELQSIFESVTKEGNGLVNADRATLFMLDDDKEELWSQVAMGEKGIIKVDVNKGIVGACAKSGEIINIPDVYQDDRFCLAFDQSTGYRTRSMLSVPIKDDDGNVRGVIQALNKANEDGTPGVFNKNDEKLLLMMASHVNAFIRIVNSG